MSALPLGLCLALATTGAGAPVFVPMQRFTLAWTHSIEKVRWEEDYEVRGPRADGGAPSLVVVAARIRGSGAGMEPPPDAVLRNGWYEYKPAPPVRSDLLLARSTFVEDYELCTGTGCRPLGALLPSDGGVTRMYACRAAPTAPTPVPNGRSTSIAP